MIKPRVFQLLATAASAADRVGDALAGGDRGWMLAALCLHICGQGARGLAWHGALRACWPGVTRRRACAWYLCGTGLSGMLSARGGDAVRLGLAKRELPGCTWPALAGTALTEGAVQALVGLPATVIALGIGVDAVRLPSTAVAGAIAAAAVAIAILAARSARIRRLLAELARGCAAFRQPRRCMSRVLAWELTGKLLRLAAVGCFLRAFGLPTSVAAVVTVGVVYGSASMLPVPGAGTAASAGALLVALPAATGHSVDASAVSAFVIAQPLVLTAAGVTISVILLGALLGARTPAALLRSGRALIAQPASPTA
jgi:hypothetical protein